MTERKQLTENEKRFTLKNVETNQKEMDLLEWNLRQIDMMLGEGIYRNYIATLEEYKRKKKMTVDRMVELRFLIGTAKDQADNGILIKDSEEIIIKDIGGD